MRELTRVLLIVLVALLIPILPFLALGESFEQRVSDWMHTEPTPTAALLSIGILASDMLLPVPSVPRGRCPESRCSCPTLLPATHCRQRRRDRS